MMGFLVADRGHIWQESIKRANVLHKLGFRLLRARMPLRHPASLEHNVRANARGMTARVTSHTANTSPHEMVCRKIQASAGAEGDGTKKASITKESR